MSKSPTSNEQKRVDALKSYQILDTLPKESYDRFTELAAIICETPISLVSLVDDHRQWFKSKHGLEVNETDRDIAFCAHTILNNSIMEVEDATKDQRFKNNPLVTSEPNIKFYAGCPLIDKNGFSLGTLCVIDREPRKLTTQQKTALKLLADSVMELIEKQRKLQEVENFDKLFQISNDLICIFDTQGQFKTTNTAFDKLLGWDELSLNKLSFFDFIHPDDLQKTNENLQKLTGNTTTVTFFHRFKTADENYKVLEWVATSEPSSNTVFAIARDITIAREKETALYNSELKLRSFFENSNGFMCTHDLDGCILTVNSSGAESLGYAKKDLIGQSLFDIIPENRHQYTEKYLSAIVTEGAVRGLMYTVHKQTGKISTWLFNNVLETDSNGDSYIIGNAVDITERYHLESELKRTTEMLEQTNEVAKIGSWEVNLKTKEIYWSAVTRAIHEVEADYQPDFSSAVAYFGEFENTITEAFKNAVENGISYDLELALNTAKGNKLWVHIIGTPEFKDEECVRIFGTFQDVTQNYLYRDALKSAKIQAEEANVAKSEFLASMSHEIRTPLNGVIGFTDLVLKTELNQTQNQYLTIVNQSANSLLAIINDILDFSKIEAGKLELDVEKSDLFELSSQASDIITFQAQQKGLEVLLNVDPNLPRFIYIDDTRLKQVLVNLLGNAVKFTDSGEIELKIYAESDTNNQFVDFHFEVRDTGIGIQSEKQSKIFEAFSQEDASTTKKYGGTGLGLTISNRLLGLMGSKLQLKSTIGKGSTFYFKLTLQAEHGEHNLTEDISFIKNALVVDDNDNNRMILRQMLLLKNIKTTEAKNGLDALQLLSTGENFDVVLMDYHMPYMDGLETIEKIRNSFGKQPKDLPILLLHSSSDDEKIIQVCETHGVNLRMVKPIKMQDLFSKLAKIHTKRETVIVAEVATKSSNDLALHILVAEDNLVNKLLAKTVIKRLLPNSVIMEASNGKEAVEQYNLQLPDLILMDLQMPVMNGYEATEKIRSLEKDSKQKTVIVALTAGNVKGEKERCLETGMDDFVTKPFVEEDLAALFAKWLTNDQTFESAHDTKNQTVTHFDLNKVMDFMSNDIEMVKMVLSLTTDEIKKVNEDFKKQLQSPNLKTINAIGHKLFGTSSSTGLIMLADLARDIEYLPEIDEQRIKSLQEALAKEVELVVELIEVELKNMD